MEEAGLQVQWAWPQRFSRRAPKRSRRGPRRNRRDLVEEAGPEVQWARGWQAQGETFTAEGGARAVALGEV